jgi:hypothetical protein
MGKWGDFYAHVCGSRRLLEGNILEHAPFITEIARFVRPGDKVLEIGSGTGVIGYPLAEGGVKVVSVDIDPDVLKQCRVNAELLGADIEYEEANAFFLPFEDREFKVSFSLGLLEHFSDEEIGALVAEHQRVADVVVVGMPIAGNKAESFGNERYLTISEWENLLIPMGAVRGFIYGYEPCCCFSFVRVKGDK